MNQQLRVTGRLWLLLATIFLAQNAWAQVVISQVYGGGGNTGATYRNDFIELFNRGTTAININGWSVQYASATGASWTSPTSLTGTIPPGGYYLVQGAKGTAGTTDLPTPDAIGTLALSGTAGKIALVSTTTPLSATCPAGATIIDFVGFGTTANCFEGTGPTPAPSNTNAVLRAANGCTDTNQNATDFTAGAPTPRNSSTTVNPCGAVVAPVASLSANPTTLTDLVATQGAVSAAQTYTVTGSNLGSNPVSVSATANIELSLNNSSFTPALSLSTTSGTLSQVVYARLTGAAPTGAFSGTITNAANGTLTASITVSGQVNAPNAPTLTASPTTLSGFTTPQGTVSAEQTYTLTAANLTAAISVSAPAGVEISQTTGSGFGSSLTLAATTSAVVYARLTGAAVGPVSGTITNVSGRLTASVAISGTVSSTAPVSPYTPIATARATATIGQTFTIQGRVTVSNQLGGRQIYVQDETGGIAVYSGASGPDFTSLVNIGDLVQTRGPVTVFNGYLELTGTNNFTVVAGAGTSVPTPVAITPGQLANYQGQLVSIANADITPVAATFTGNTNYTITAGGQSGTLRISANSPLAGAGQPANPVSVTGVADRFVSKATTTGTDGMQFLPRILADIPGSTPATDLTCTIGSSSTLTRDQTLDIAAWNFEFFGADAGTISCPNGTTLAYNNFGPTDEAKQQANATTVLTKLNADIISAEEISNLVRFDAAVKAMPGSYSYVCSNRFSYYFQDECDQTPSGNPPIVFGPTKYAQKVCVIYNMATVTPVLAETKALLDGKYNYPNASNWSSGRLPFLFVANVTINGLTQKIHVVALHAKSGSATADYNRRKQDVIDLKAELDANYADANIVILGDYNDKLNGSIATGQQSSYQPFVTDATNYSAITLPLENQGCSTFNASASFIDHIITSSELAKGYVGNSAYVLQPFSIPNYGNTTSDHNPVEARFDLSQFVSPVAALTLTASANPTQILTTGTTTLSATVAGGTSPYSYTFSGPGVITQTTNTASVSGLSAGVQTFTVVAKDATLPTSQTISGTVSVTVTSPVPVTVTGPFAITGVTTVSCVTVSTGLRTVRFTPQYTGVSGQPISFSVVNEMLPTTNAGPYPLNLYTDNPVITLKATQRGTAGEVSFVYNWLGACNAGGTPPPPPTSPFSITGVTTVSCVTVSTGLRTVRFTPRYAGLSGAPISFSVVNEMLPVTTPGPYTLNLYTDNPSIVLKATQSGTAGEASFVYNWLAACNGGARVGAEPVTGLDVRVMGNPVQNGQVVVEVMGAMGQPLQLHLTDLRGQVIRSHQVEQAGSVEQHTFELGRQSAGLLLLRASTPTQSRTVKVMKTD